MLIKTKLGDRTLYTSRSLLTTPQQNYVRPAEGNLWFQTTTSVWRVDELIRRRVRDWRRMMGETGHTGTRAESMRKDHDSVYTATHSVFPAPLIEWIILRYGGAPGSRILDAFAGGPPRSVVASIMGHQYLGFEIRQDQIDENVALLNKLKLMGTEFVLGDGRFMDEAEGEFDLGFTCPPYHDLEQYSDLAADLSNMGSYEEFRAGIWFCAQNYYRLLKPGSFMCFVVGNFRDKTGELTDFRAHAVEDFRDAGFKFWQEIILSKNFGSAAKRSTNAWKGQKLVPIHEFLLVFKKEV